MMSPTRSRVSAHAAAHHVSIFGQTLSYPAANAGAVIVLALALLGAIVTGIALRAIGIASGRQARGADHARQWIDSIEEALLARRVRRVGDLPVIRECGFALRTTLGRRRRRAFDRRRDRELRRYP